MGKQRKETPPVCAVVGSDPFLRNAAVAKLLAALGGGSVDLAPTRCDGSRASAADVLDEVRTPSLLGDRRVVIVDDADEFIARHRQSVENYCASPSETGVLILLCDSLPKNTRLHRVLAERDAVIACEAPKGRQLDDWIARRATEEHGKKIAPSAVQMLRRLLGDAPGWIDAELGKLAAFAGDRKEITASDVEELTDHRREEKVFAIVDAMADGEPGKALGLWEQVLATDRAATGRAIGGLAFKARQLVEARRELDATGNVFTAGRRLFWDADAARRRFERVSTAKALAWQRGLLEADLEVKTGLTTTESAVEKFIVKHGSEGTGE